MLHQPPMRHFYHNYHTNSLYKMNMHPSSPSSIILYQPPMTHFYHYHYTNSLCMIKNYASIQPLLHNDEAKIFLPYCFYLGYFKMASGSNGFRAKVFDPLLIVSQIIALQVFFYVSLGLWIIFADVIARLTPSFDQLFSYKVSE